MADEAKENVKKAVLDTDKHAVGAEKAKKGAFNRTSSIFLNRVSNKVDKIIENEDGSKTFPVAANRYHIYLSPACPWCHRCWLTLELKGLTDVISISFVAPYLKNLGNARATVKVPKEEQYRGWSFTNGFSKEEQEKYNSYLAVCGVNNGKDEFTYDDPLRHKNDIKFDYIADLYEYCDKNYSKSYSVPILWDKETDTIVNNESSIIIEMLNSEFDALSNIKDKSKIPNLSPEKLKDAMNSVNDWVYPQINNGVYASGFARSQEAYNEAVVKVFDGLDKCESILKESSYIAGNNDGLTLSDIRLWVTLIRFDRIYYDHFKCNLKRICDAYPCVNEYIYRLYNMPQFKKTVFMEHFKYHYFYSHATVNGHQIVPIGPDIPYTHEQAPKK